MKEVFKVYHPGCEERNIQQNMHLPLLPFNLGTPYSLDMSCPERENDNYFKSFAKLKYDHFIRPSINPPSLKISDLKNQKDRSKHSIDYT